MVACVSGVHNSVQTEFKWVKPGENLDDNHMSKIIVWCVQSFKKEYPLLFDREYSVRGPKVKYEWDELLAYDFYCVYHNKRSCRKKADWLSNNDESCNYILNNKRPGKTSINDFKRENPLLFLEFFQYTVDLGIRFDLVGGEVVTLDSTTVKAYANNFRTLSIIQLDYLLDLIHDLSFDTSKNSQWCKLRKYFFNDKLPEDLVDLIKEIQKNLNVHGINLLKTALQSHEKRDWVIDLLDELVDNYDGSCRVNLTDIDSRRMKMKDGTSKYAYMVQTVRDIKTGFVISQEVSQEKNDKHALIPAIDNVISALGKSPRLILADHGYWTFEALEYSYMNNILPLIPDRNDSMRRNGTNKDDPYDRCNMYFDCVEECYVCPCGEILPKGDIKNIKGTLKYRFRTEACPDCPFHDECTSRKYRDLYEPVHPLVLESKKNFLSDAGQYYYKFRGIYSEGGFGTMKNAREYPGLRRKGKQKADIDLKIEATVDNLIKIRDHLNATLINLK